MPKIQMDMPEKLNDKLKIAKAQLGYSNLQKTVIALIEEYIDKFVDKKR